jgi:KDO2-lipid IV(A) lauroyltransferase
MPSRTTVGVVRLARWTGAAVVPAHGYWYPSLKKYRLRYEPALDLVKTADEEADICADTKLFNRTLERFIRRFPDQWFWVHRRWKNRPPGEEPIYSREKMAQ